MADKQPNLQDQFLNAVRRAKLPVSIFVTKGVKLQGIIPWFDAFAVLLRRDGNGQLVYKHSISTIMPAGELRQFDPPLPPVGGSAPLQDRFLHALATGKSAVTIFLVNGVMLQGEVAGFDQFSLLLRRGALVQLVYKHAVSTIQPDTPVSLGWEGADEPQAELAD